MGNVAKGRVDEEICRRDLPITVDAMVLVRLPNRSNLTR
jgi:hypothetical protein